MVSLQKQKCRYGRTFLLCLALAAALFAPHCIIDGLNGDFFHYAGDFNDQMIPFYAYTNDFVKQGARSAGPPIWAAALSTLTLITRWAARFSG